MSERPKPPAELSITSYMHCAKCLQELPANTTPQDYARNSVGFTKIGLQVFCNRHNLNVAHIDFEGMRHPANLHGV